MATNIIEMLNDETLKSQQQVLANKNKKQRNKIRYLAEQAASSHIDTKTAETLAVSPSAIVRIALKKPQHPRPYKIFPKPYKHKSRIQTSPS